MVVANLNCILSSGKDPKKIRQIHQTLELEFIAQPDLKQAHPRDMDRGNIVYTKPRVDMDWVERSTPIGRKYNL